MLAEVTRKLFTVDEYYRMAEVGILTPEDRVELIEGEIIEMSPIGNRHAGCVNRAMELFVRLFSDRATITVQNPVRLNSYNEPVPDLIVAKRSDDYYSSHHPTPEDLLFVVEVADASLRKDRDLKLPIYARLVVREVWIEDLRNGQILVFRDLRDNKYQSCLTLKRGDALSPLAFPSINIKVEQLLG